MLAGEVGQRGLGADPAAIAQGIEDCHAAAVAEVLRRQLEMVSAQACSRGAGAGSQALGVDAAGGVGEVF